MGQEDPLEKGQANPLQYSWDSLVAQTIKNPPVMKETWVQSLGWEDPLEEGMATHSSILAWRISMDRETWRAIVHGVTKSWTWLSNWKTTIPKSQSISPPPHLLLGNSKPILCICEFVPLEVFLNTWAPNKTQNLAFRAPWRRYLKGSPLLCSIRLHPYRCFFIWNRKVGVQEKVDIST